MSTSGNGSTSFIGKLIAPFRLLTPILWLFMGTMILANVAAQMDGPLRPLYIQELGASVKQIGIFFTLGAIAPLLFQIFGGWLSDSIGRLQAIAIGSLGGVMSYVIYIFAPSWQWLLLASVSVSMAYAFVGPSFSAFIAEQSTEETRGRVYGITSTLFMVVNIVGPVVGGLIAQGLSFKVLFIVAGVLYGSAALIRVLMARFAGRKQTAQSEQTEQAPRSGFSQFKTSLVSIIAMMTAGGLLTWIFISDGVRDVAFGLTDQLMPIYLENEMGLTILQIGTLQSITAIAAMFFMSPAGWLSDKAGERVGIVGGFALIAVGWTVFLYGSSFTYFIASRLIIGIGWALIDPAYNSLISKAVPEKQRGLAFGFFASSISLIALPAPWIGAQLWEAFTPRFPFFIPLIALVAMLPVMWIKFKLPSDTSGGDPAVLSGVTAAPAPETGR